MDQFSQVITMVGGIVATILIPLIGAFQFYDSKKRKEAAVAKKRKPIILHSMQQNGKGVMKRNVRLKMCSIRK